MASSSAPNHDFAPAWLKIPTNAQKPSGASNNDSLIRREDIASLHAPQLSSKPKALSQEQRRDRGRTTFPYRHHSIDTDDPQHHSHFYGGNNEYRLTQGQKEQSGSQPSLGRRPLSRQDFRDNSSPSFSSGYKNFNSYDNGSENFRGGSHWGRQHSFERAHSTHGSTSGRSSQSAAEVSSAPLKDGAKWRKEEPVDKFDKEFPSLKGGTSETASSSVATVGVWDTTKTGKIHLSSSVSKKLHLVQKPIRNDIKRSSSPNSVNTTSGSSSPKSISHATILKQATKNNASSSSVYRTLVSAKGPMIRRPSKDSAKANGLPAKTSTTPPLEILNTRLVTHPKNLGNKNEFLKELRDDGSSFGPSAVGEAKDSLESSNGHDDVGEVMCEERYGEEVVCEMRYEQEEDEEDCKHQETYDEKSDHPDMPEADVPNGTKEQSNTENFIQQAINGIDIEKSPQDSLENKILSRSLEAEQRLLREMGWKEEGSEDEGVYAPLTEDEMKEFENLSKKIPKRNGFQRNIQFTWSPKHVLTIPSAIDLANESSGTTSSSDTDSD